MLKLCYNYKNTKGLLLILKSKDMMTGKELHQLEGYIFPIVIAAEQPEARKQEFVKLIENHGEDIVKLCYLNDKKNPINEVEEQFRFQVMQDFPQILAFVFDGGNDEGKQQPKPKPQSLKR